MKNEMSDLMSQPSRRDFLRLGAATAPEALIRSTVIRSATDQGNHHSVGEGKPAVSDGVELA